MDIFHICQKISEAKFLEIDFHEIPVPFAVLQGYKVVQSLHFMMIFARVVQIAIAATGFTCSTAANKLRFILSDSQCLRESNQGFLFFFFFWLFLLQNARKSSV